MPRAGVDGVKISRTKGVNTVGSDLIPQEAIQSKILVLSGKAENVFELSGDQTQDRGDGKKI